MKRDLSLHQMIICILAFTVIIIFFVTVAHYNFTEQQRSIACANQGLGYESGGCVRP